MSTIQKTNYSSFLVWSDPEKGLTLYVITRDGSYQPFSCGLGHFQHGDNQTNERPIGWSKSKPALDQWEGNGKVRILLLPLRINFLAWCFTSDKIKGKACQPSGLYILEDREKALFQLKIKHFFSSIQWLYLRASDPLNFLNVSWFRDWLIDNVMLKAASSP